MKRAQGSQSGARGGWSALRRFWGQRYGKSRRKNRGVTGWKSEKIQLLKLGYALRNLSYP